MLFFAHSGGNHVIGIYISTNHSQAVIELSGPEESGTNVLRKFCEKGGGSNAKYSSKGKSKEEILEEMEKLGEGGVDYPLFDAMTAATQVRIVDQLCGRIGAAGEDFLRTSTALKESIDKFKESNEKTSKVLIWLTVVLAGAGLVQALALMFK